jgi:hypothetical protein
MIYGEMAVAAIFIVGTIAGVVGTVGSLFWCNNRSKSLWNDGKCPVCGDAWVKVSESMKGKGLQCVRCLNYLYVTQKQYTKYKKRGYVGEI